MGKPVTGARRGAPHPPTGGLAFVHLNHPDDIRDREVQTGIRRHVMRDIGRSRRQRPRHRVVSLEVASPGELESRRAGINSEHDANILARRREAKVPFRVLSSVHFTGNYPVEPDRRALELLHFMQSEMDYKYRPFRIVWLRMAITDAATFNLSLAHGVVFLNELRRRAGFDFMYDDESVKYLSRALKQLSFYLGNDSSRVSEGAVCTILGLACKDANTGNWNQWSTHMDGLEQIYRLRGGFHGMGHNLPILAVWLDLLGAAVFDVKPRFTLPTELDHEPLVVNDHDPSKFATLLQKLEKTTVDYVPAIEALALMSMVAAAVNSGLNQPLFWKNDVGAVGIIAPATHHLLSMSRRPASTASQPPSSVPLTKELVRLSCLILLAAVKARFSLPATEIFDFHDRYCHLFAQGISYLNSEALEVVLWTAIIVSLLSPTAKRKNIIPHIRMIMARLGIDTGLAAVQMVEQLVWIRDLMSEEATSLAHEIDTSLLLEQGSIS